MKPAELAKVRGDLVAFAAQMLAPLPRSDQRRWGETYLRGLMLHGQRKSIEPLAARLADGDEQCLPAVRQPEPLGVGAGRQRLALRMSAALEPRAWIIDEAGFPKAGRSSVGVARQYSGTLGKVAGCQIGVSVSAAPAAASCPLTWRLFLPAAWDCDAPRRAKARLPAGERHREKWRLALEMLDELRDWGLSPPALVADAGYGEVSAFRAALEERELSYVVEVKAATSAYREDVLPERPAGRGAGRPAASRYRRRRASWRYACGPPTSACGAPTAHSCRSPGCSASGRKGRTSRRSTGLRTCRRRRRSPSSCASPSCAGASSRTTASWKDALGLDHFEGRSFRGWHHHVTLVSLAHGFLTLQRLDPKADAPA